MLKPNHISPQLLAKREYIKGNQQDYNMEPERAPAGLLEYKYNHIIGFK
jgi:hypothetical protein